MERILKKLEYDFVFVRKNKFRDDGEIRILLWRQKDWRRDDGGKVSAVSYFIEFFIFCNLLGMVFVFFLVILIFSYVDFMDFEIFLPLY